MTYDVPVVSIVVTSHQEQPGLYRQRNTLLCCIHTTSNPTTLYKSFPIEASDMKLQTEVQHTGVTRYKQS